MRVDNFSNIFLYRKHLHSQLLIGYNLRKGSQKVQKMIIFDLLFVRGTKLLTVGDQPINISPHSLHKLEE